MAGLVAFELGVVQIGEFGCGGAGVVKAGVGGEGRAEFAQEVAEGVALDGEGGVVAVPDEVEGVAGGGDRGGVDTPAAVRPAAGVEAVGDVRGEREPVGAGSGGGVGLGGEDFFVGEFGEEFRE